MAYFIRTRSGAYNSMLRRNLELSLARQTPGTSLTFSDMVPQMATLKLYEE